MSSLRQAAMLLFWVSVFVVSFAWYSVKNEYNSLEAVRNYIFRSGRMTISFKNHNINIIKSTATTEDFKKTIGEASANTVKFSTPEYGPYYIEVEFKHNNKTLTLTGKVFHYNYWDRYYFEILDFTDSEIKGFKVIKNGIESDNESPNLFSLKEKHLNKESSI